MKLFLENEPLLKIFIELLPERFIEKKYVREFACLAPKDFILGAG
jgi:hypothetical protein